MIKFCLALCAVAFGSMAMAAAAPVAETAPVAEAAAAPAAVKAAKPLMRYYYPTIIGLPAIGNPGSVSKEWKEKLSAKVEEGCAKTLAECNANPKARDCKKSEGGVTDVKSKLLVSTITTFCSVNYNIAQ